MPTRSPATWSSSSPGPDACCGRRRGAGPNVLVLSGASPPNPATCRIFTQQAWHGRGGPMRTRRWHSRGGGALTATVLGAAALAVPVLAVTALSAPAGAGARPNALPDNQPPVPAGNPLTVFAKDGPYKAGVAFETTAVGDTVVVTYPVDPATAVGKPTYTVNLLRWFTGSPTAPVPPGLPQNLPTTLSTDAYQSVPAR